MLVEFKGLGLDVAENKKYEWTMPTKDVARGYEVSESVIKKHKIRHADELEEGKHFFVQRDKLSLSGEESNLESNSTLWTKKGVIRLGFFIRSERAKLFRDWAEEFILSGGAKKACRPIPKLPPIAHIKEANKLYGKEFGARMIVSMLGANEEEAEAMMQAFHKNNEQSPIIHTTTVPSEETEEFVAERIVRQRGFASTEDIYADYTAWCVEKSYTPLSKVVFGKEFKAATGLESKVVKVSGVSTRGYEGIAIAQI